MTNLTAPEAVHALVAENARLTAELSEYAGYALDRRAVTNANAERDEALRPD